jgi:hypothetical protein
MGNYWLACCGELGWAEYVSAYANYLHNNGHDVVVWVQEEWGDLIQPEIKTLWIEDDFFMKYGSYSADCFGRHGVLSSELKNYFDVRTKELMGDEWEIAPKFNLGYQDRKVLEPFYIFKPYIFTIAQRIKNRILIFPRYRKPCIHIHSNKEMHAFRNLSKKFYCKLILQLGTHYPDCIITTVGVPSGAYEFSDYVFPDIKFEDMVKEDMTLSKMLDLIMESYLTVGGTSAPPKIALKQGVPSYIIGHEQERFTSEENPMKTKTGFYNVGTKEDYQNFNERECLSDILSFCQEVIE